MTPIEKVREALWWAHIEISAQLVKEGCTYKEMGNYVTLREIEAAQRELDGMVIVPVEPTEEMHKLAEREWDGRMSARSAGVYKTMIAPYLPEKQNDR